MFGFPPLSHTLTLVLKDLSVHFIVSSVLQLSDLMWNTLGSKMPPVKSARLWCFLTHCSVSCSAQIVIRLIGLCFCLATKSCSRKWKQNVKFSGILPKVFLQQFIFLVEVWVLSLNGSEGKWPVPASSDSVQASSHAYGILVLLPAFFYKCMLVEFWVKDAAGTISHAQNT